MKKTEKKKKTIFKIRENVSSAFWLPTCFFVWSFSFFVFVSNSLTAIAFPNNICILRIIKFPHHHDDENEIVSRESMLQKLLNPSGNAPFRQALER